MKTQFRVIAEKKDITDILQDRLLSLNLTDKPGMASDTCEIRLDDRDGRLEFPRKGATLEIHLGYAGQPLTYMGTFKVDEITLSGPPRLMSIRGKSVNMTSTLKDQRRHAWESTTLKTIVADVAQRNGLQPVIDVDMTVQRVDQLNESDMHFLTRLALQYGCSASVKEGKLIVVETGSGNSGSGRDMPVQELHCNELSHYSFTFPDRSLYGKATAHYVDDNGQQQKVEATNDNAPPTALDTNWNCRHPASDKDIALVTVKAKQRQLNQQTAKGNLDIAVGTARFWAEHHIKLTGIKDDVDGEYLVESVDHTFDKSGWKTRLSVNAGNNGKANAGRSSTQTAAAGTTLVKGS